VTGVDGAEEAEEPLSLRSIPAIEAHMPTVESSRTRVLDAMENMVRQGLTTLVSDNPDVCVMVCDGSRRIKLSSHPRFRPLSTSPSCRTWSPPS
jgi:hypothetical protein